MNEELKPHEQIAWWSFESDEKIKEKLVHVVHEMHIANARFGAMNEEDVASFIKQHIASTGLPGTITIRVMPPKDHRSFERTGRGVVSSPKTGEDIDFEF